MKSGWWDERELANAVVLIVVVASLSTSILSALSATYMPDPTIGRSWAPSLAAHLAYLAGSTSAKTARRRSDEWI
jgi:hypothetical protein